MDEKNNNRDEVSEQDRPLSRCALKHLEKYQELSEKMLEKTFSLPCGCESAPLKALLNSYACSKCRTKYLYSFCWNEVVTEESTWHCEYCGSC